MEINNEKIEKIPFKRYFYNLDAEQKRDFFHKVGPYASSSHIYTCMRTNKYTLRLRLALETITNQQFNWEDEEI
jgi:hypothetical protein